VYCKHFSKALKVVKEGVVRKTGKVIQTRHDSGIEEVAFHLWAQSVCP
jgi:hypothetical protein